MLLNIRTLRCFLVMISFCASCFTFAQNDIVTIQGTVYSNKDSALVENVRIILTVNDSIRFFDNTSAEGRYEFQLRRFKGTLKVHCETTRTSRSNKKKNALFLTSKDIRIIDMRSSSGIFQADFTLYENACNSMRVPYIYFKKNSTELEDTLLNKFSEGNGLLYLISVAKQNPEITLKIYGHCDPGEKNGTLLSGKRAELVKAQLVAAGLEKERFECAAYGGDQAIISGHQIKKARTESEKEQLRARNRVVSVSILSFDYGLPKKKPSAVTDDDDD